MQRGALSKGPQAGGCAQGAFVVHLPLNIIQVVWWVRRRRMFRGEGGYPMDQLGNWATGQLGGGC